MAHPDSIVIVGGGLAGAKGAEGLREQGFQGGLTVIGAEDQLPYERPPLSKSYLQGKSTLADAQVHNRDWYDDNSVDLRLATTVAAVRPGAHEIELAGGETIGYGALLLATGSTPRRLPVPGADAAGILTLRRVEDSDAIRETFGADRRLAIIGGGWIGLEVAAAAREAGTEVTVIEATAAPLLAVLGPNLAAVFATLHTDHGVTLYTEARVAEILATDGRASGVRLADGTVIPADAVVVGIGAAPNTELAEQAGLAVDNGVLVSAALRSSDPDIYAVGDIANAEHPFVGTRIRVEHWANALNQPAVAAAAMLGNDVSYDALPYFYTDQYDLGMEYVGHAPPGSYSQVVVRGDLPAREFVAFWLDAESRVLAGMNVNVWDVTDPIKALIRSRNAMTASLLADPTVLLEDLA
jgi:3-phenylpropionate/trans-cinnamate dioxygenase ferredoxin reductase component